MDDVQVWFNPRCSKCRGAEELLVDKGVKPELIRYLDDAPSPAAIREVLAMLGETDPRVMMRKGEPEYKGLESATESELITAMHEHPILIERPIVIKDGRAVIARPPELLLELL